ncbi:hypothetical protein J5226_18680 [Lysobacter sp. K5869]|uniref:hypothetical protein n=1 Tax=Lysobacter sp. K5869 TaxID=2820808 RepID=UPI001C05F420|nr:hypothetical protein [Lysobacter sp. K5869]QWP75619.1 hypothetical protein J5226_18680 [Lysobacter sp. K5869]
MRQGEKPGRESRLRVAFAADIAADIAALSLCSATPARAQATHQCAAGNAQTALAATFMTGQDSGSYVRCPDLRAMGE